MNNKRKNRPGPTTRPQRGRILSAQGIYNNSFFMHAAASLVGNLVQVQTHSGSIYEGIFRTYSSNFEVALDLAECIQNNPNQKSDNNKLPNHRIIFQANHIVSIVSKDVDLDFATGGAFQTDSAISSRCNGSSRFEEKELEPWDATGRNVNGEIDLELDGNANGWDVNEMFNKNEKLYGVQSTFDNSLAGYTVQIEKKDTQDYKDAEAEAEKIAQEIESQPNYKERTDLENGDEESRFAAVERPIDQQSPEILPPPPPILATPTISTALPPPPQPTSIINNSKINNNNNINSNIMSKGTSSVDKYVPPPKRKNLQTGKLVRSTPPPSNNNNNTNNNNNNNNGRISQHNAHNSSKNNNYQNIQMQQGPPPYILNQSYSHIHGHPANLSQAKTNGDGNISNIYINKSLPQRGLRYDPPQSITTVFYSEQSSSIGGEMQVGKPPVHMTHNHSHATAQHLNNNRQETSPSQGHMVVQQSHHAVLSGGPPTQNHPPPQPQRQPRARDEQIQDLRKFQQDFNLSSSNQPPQSQINQVKTPSVSPHQQPQPSHSPSQQLSNLQPQLQHSQQQQQQQQQVQSQQQQQNDNSPPLSVSKNSQHMQQQQHIQQDQQNYTGNQSSLPQQQQQQQQETPTAIIPTGGSGIPVVSSTASPQQRQNQSILNTNSNNGNGSTSIDKPVLTSGAVKKTHVLNPAAKPFTPRSPSTPNPSRPHTPQTPGPSMTSGVYPQGPHVSAGQPPMLATYVMQSPQSPFQTPTHPHPNQTRMRRTPMQVSAAAATGQPLLTAAPIQQFIHYQQAAHSPHFPSQPYQHMVRMYHEPPPPQQIQFLAQTTPSTTQSPGQPHQQFHPGAQPSPTGGGPLAFGPGAQPPPFSMMCPVIASHPQLVPNYYQSVTQTPHHAQQFQVIMQQQHPAQ